MTFDTKIATRIHDNLCDLIIKRDNGKKLQLSQCFISVYLPKVDKVHHGSQGGVSDAPHEDEWLRVVQLQQQVFEEPAGGGEDQPVRVDPLAIFADQGDIREVNR